MYVLRMLVVFFVIHSCLPHSDEVYGLGRLRVGLGWGWGDAGAGRIWAI